MRVGYLCFYVCMCVMDVCCGMYVCFHVRMCVCVLRTHGMYVWFVCMCLYVYVLCMCVFYVCTVCAYVCNVCVQVVYVRDERMLSIYVCMYDLCVGEVGMYARYIYYVCTYVLSVCLCVCYECMNVFFRYALLCYVTFCMDSMRDMYVCVVCELSMYDMYVYACMLCM